MKVKIGKQEAAYNAIKEYRSKNAGATLKEAMIQVAKKTGSSTTSVQAAYYTFARRNGDALAARTPRNAVEAPPKKKTTKVKKTKSVSNNLDLNIVRASLTQALDTIQALENENKRNREIINGLRKTLSV